MHKEVFSISFSYVAGNIFWNRAFPFCSVTYGACMPNAATYRICTTFKTCVL